MFTPSYCGGGGQPMMETWRPRGLSFWAKAQVLLWVGGKEKC